MDEDAFEALFATREEDIQNGSSLFGEDGGDNLSDEDLDKLQSELQEALGIGNDDDVEMIYSERGDIKDGNGAGEDDDKEEEGEERPLKLKTWQLRRLASALKIGRRKISIKSLAAEVCLDRAVVLQLLRDPPPNLVLMSAALTDKPAFQYVPENKPIENVPAEAATADAVRSEKEVKVPVHVMRNRWSAQKRLKIAQVYTLERVYEKTRRPTNTMIDSIVHLTNLPRKRVVQWFEDKRKEDGVPHNRLPYQRSAPKTVPSF
uniref:Homeobox domain-containing protein n=1 Tax=Rhizophora mucronata TaxID=61149 RepID=A0A2P2JVV4_RHIMU